MFKFYTLILLSLLISGSLCAQEATPSLFDEEPATSENKTEDKKENTVAKDNNKEDIASPEKKDDALFNFLGIKIPDFIPKAIKPKEPETLPKSTNENSLTNLSQKAEKGDVTAQLKLGYAYLYGNDKLKADYQKAFHYYQLAAKQNDKTGLNNLGTLYYNGLGTTKNTTKAAELFAKAAAEGNFESATNLGFMYISGNGIEKDISKGIVYLNQAAEGGNLLAKFMIGYALYQGKYLPADYIKAAPYIKAAADAGLDEAQIILSDMYIKGHGYPQNYSFAVNYLNLAVAQGNVVAMVKLADIYSGQLKYPADIIAAHTLYNLAFVRGINQALPRIEMLQANMQIEQIMQAQKAASSYRERPSQLTDYVRQTFGSNIHLLLE